MKLSAILVSVTLPVAASTAAYSAEPAKGGTADWLKQNLASFDGKQKKALAKPRKGAFSQPVADAAGGLHAGPALRMRPFVANRKLPSQRDLDMQLIARTAQMASSQNVPTLASQTATMAMAPQPLSGNVSEVYSMMPYGSASANNVATYGAVGYVPQSSSRVVPGQVPVVQNQIRQFHSGKRTRYIAPSQAPTLGEVDSLSAQMPAPPSPPLEVMMQSALSQGQLLQQQPMQTMQQSMPMPMAPQQQAQRFNAPMLVPMQAPPFTPDEQAILDRMSMSRGDGSDSSSGAAGPPPFPLSLLPQDSLKQIISQSRSRRSDAPPSYFGCWHGVPQTAGLPRSGFHSYTGAGSVYGNHYSHYAAHNTAGGPLASGQSTTRSRAKASGETTHSLAQLRRLPPQEIKVASYSSYPRLSGSGY